ncbi:MAG: metal ABC transporter substrate-binding protein [Clostridia bacterium]|nr:metal ABC transporter substrate-binding protein [Clostridia bacterium]
MKKFVSILLCALLFTSALSGCKSEGAEGTNKLSIVTTIFPEYDWTRAILGDSSDFAELTLLMDNGVDLHSFQPSADDIIKIATCDLFIYVGGESDTWVSDALKEAVNEDMVVINLLEVLGDSVKSEELIYGMQAEEHDHDHGASEDDHDHGASADEHVWLSLKNAELCCAFIAKTLAAMDPDHAEDYSKNAAAYIDELSALDLQYQAVTDAAKRKVLLFGDRFPFRYLADDYNLTCYAAFVGCSAETEASFETVAFLAGKVDELGLPCVLTIEGSEHRVAQTIVENTESGNQTILRLDSMQSIKASDIEGGASYLSIMEANLEILRQALN